MSKNEKEGLMRCLLSWREGMTLRNIKFYRGDRDVIDPSEVVDAIASITDQKEQRTAECSSEPVKSTVSTIDVRAFVANI